MDLGADHQVKEVRGRLVLTEARFPVDGAAGRKGQVPQGLGEVVSRGVAHEARGADQDVLAEDRQGQGGRQTHLMNTATIAGAFFIIGFSLASSLLGTKSSILKLDRSGLLSPHPG